MAGFFDKLMSAVNKVEKAADTVKNIQKSLSDTASASNKAVETEEITGLRVSDIKADYASILSDEVYSFEYNGTNCSYKVCKPTNFFKANNDFGAAEICNVYFFSSNGAEPSGFWTWDSDKMSKHTQIFFGDWEYDINSMKDSLSEVYLKNHGVKSCKAEFVDKNGLKYRVVGENNDTYYESCFYVTEGRWEDDAEAHENYLQIALSVDKTGMTEEQIKLALSEFRAIIDTIDFKC